MLTETMPCLRCGKGLDLSSDGVVCECGATYEKENVLAYLEPGYYREWLNALSCACGMVEHYDGDRVRVLPHRCQSGGVMWMKRNEN